MNTMPIAACGSTHGNAAEPASSASATAATSMWLSTWSASHPIGYCNAMLPIASTASSRIASASASPISTA